MFFSFDGIDGVGKSTQMRLFHEWLLSEGYDVVTCRDPGSTALGEKIRDIVLNSDHSTSISPRSEMLLYMAARAQLVDEIIEPAISTGKQVICDRFLLANIVYQGYAGGVSITDIRQVGNVATAGVMPDCVFLLDMSPTTARERMGRSLDRIEMRGDDYREHLRRGYLTEAKVMGNKVHVIDANRTVDEIQNEIQSIAIRLFG